MPRLKKCQHCGSRIRAKRHRIFCSIICEFEHRKDARVNQQRLNTFQALAEKGSWLAIDNAILYRFAAPGRKVKVVEECQFNNLTHYRLTSAGHKLLDRWKSQLTISAQGAKQ